MRRTLMLLFALLVMSTAVADAGTWVHYRYHHWWGPHYYYHWWGPRVFVQMQDSDIAVVDTDISPEHARLYLDGKFIGLADDFDGYPDYMYLKPGSYKLEVQLGGYTTELIDLKAEDNQWYELDFKLQRLPNEPKERSRDRPQRPKPVTRRFEPAVQEPSQPAVQQRPARAGHGPDLSLRPDLATRRLHDRPEVAAADLRAASLRLQVTPTNASVYLDGAFLGTGEQLAAMQQPVAIKVGRHTIEVLAPGLAPEQRVFEIGAGEAVDLKLVLQQEEQPEPSAGE